MADLLITDASRDAVVASGLLLGTTEGAVTYRVVASLPEAARLLHDARRTYTRITIVGVPAADTGSIRSTLTVLQARGTRVRWFDTHEMLWTSDVRGQFDYLEVETHLPDPHRPETERVAGLVLAWLEEEGHPRVRERAGDLTRAVRETRAADFGNPDWITLVDAVVHDHRLVANRTLRAAASRVWDPGSPLDEAERRLVSLQRSREARAEQFLEQLADEAAYGQEILSIDATSRPELRYLRPWLYAEPARRRTGSSYCQVLVGRNWAFACRDPYGSGIDLQIAYLEQLFDLDVKVSGYPHRATVRVESGADLNGRLMKALEAALENERKGRNRPAFSPDLDLDIDW